MIRIYSIFRSAHSHSFTRIIEKSKGKRAFAKFKKSCHKAGHQKLVTLERCFKTWLGKNFPFGYLWLYDDLQTFTILGRQCFHQFKPITGHYCMMFPNSKNVIFI